MKGWQFSDGKITRALVMNLTLQDDSPDGTPLAQFQRQVTQLSAAPAASASEIKQATPQPGPGLTFPARSLTLLR